VVAPKADGERVRTRPTTFTGGEGVEGLHEPSICTDEAERDGEAGGNKGG